MNIYIYEKLNSIIKLVQKCFCFEQIDNENIYEKLNEDENNDPSPNPFFPPPPFASQPIVHSFSPVRMGETINQGSNNFREFPN
jgi:hypothetical protein